MDFLWTHHFLSFQILNTKVIFNAEITEGGSDVIGNLTFDRVDINIGNGFDGTSGIFKVPVTGIYKMTFSGQSHFNKGVYTQVFVYKNGILNFGICDGNRAENANKNNV